MLSPPLYPSMPTADDVENKLRSITFWPEGEDGDSQILRAKHQTQIGAWAAEDEWERITGWTPFCSPAGAEDQTRLFQVDAVRFGRKPVLQLRSGLISLAGVTVGVTNYELSRVVAKPDNARERGGPFFWLYFPPYYGRWWGSALRAPLQITITGRWGYCASEEEGVPADVWSTVLDRAVLITLLGVENPRDISSLSQDGFNIAFDPVGPIDPKTVLSSLGKQFPQIAERYKRPVG